MADALETLSIGEQEQISAAILEMINACPEKPNGIIPQYQYIKDAESIGIFTLQGAVYLKKYLSGTFEAQYPFLIRYRCKPGNNAGRVKKQKVLDQIAEWLEKIEYPALTENRKIKSITRTTTAFLFFRDESGNEEYQCNLNLKYTKRG